MFFLLCCVREYTQKSSDRNGQRFFISVSEQAGGRDHELKSSHPSFQATCAMAGPVSESCAAHGTPSVPGTVHT